MELKTGNIPTGAVYNQGLTASNIDTDSCRYSPRAITQYEIETAGSQNAALINQDVNIIGSFSAGTEFRQVTANNLVDAGGIVVINPTVSDKVANALLYQGYSVMDGSL